MKEFQQIEALINGREIKKADVIIARLMKLDLPADDMANLFIFRARTRLLYQADLMMQLTICLQHKN